MKTVIRTLFLVLILQSCSNKKNNSEIFGHWISTKSANTVELKFFKDSLIYYTWDKTTKFTWESDGTKIYYTQLTNIDPELETDFIMEYRLNSEKDTLFVKTSESDFTNEFIKKTAD
ncbi:hypothetical protein [Neotamlana laminarinivorans]|uniref:Uncharacterized protein n=1 Tax=Neotamlana laminarinivorans TaxID=2883124 RepID=A0A9X1I1Z0_9FLAO|nr:hypothetical protein [Tamlana laminarinivorans]MCB4800314.1 hypothetical protein [Tamlana laminarinivorans]